VLALVPVEGVAPATDPTRNLQRALDLAVFGEAHVWQGAATDPEGLLGTPAAVVTCLMGYWAGVFLRDRVLTGGAAARLCVAGVLIASVGEASSLIVPVNKALWTPSFVLLSGGLAMVCLAVSLWVVDLRKVRWLFGPLRDMGLNPIVVFVGAGMSARLLSLAKVGDYAEAPTVRAFVFDEMVSFGVPPRLASLLFALVFVFAWWVVARVLAQFRFVIRV
jgi:predicted acyltransferase